MQTSAGIRELKARLSSYLREVEAGGTVGITKHGKPIGRIVPEAQSIPARLKSLKQAGLIDWSGKELHKITPVAKAKGNKTVADLLLKDRE